MPSDIQTTLNAMMEAIQRPFWRQPGFWLSTVIGVVGVYFSIRAWLEASEAKKAATAAGRAVKLQSVAVELTEIMQKLDRLRPETRFSEARDLLAETSRRLRRATSPFAKETALSEPIEASRQALNGAQESLKRVRPADPAKEDETPFAVYYALEDDFTNINNCVADLLGSFDKQSLNFGDDDANA